MIITYFKFRFIILGSKYHAMLVKLNQILTKNLYNSVEHYMTLKQPTTMPNMETHGEAFLWKQWDQEYSDRYFKLTPSAYPNKSDFITMEANEALISLFEKHTEFLNKLSSRYFNQTFHSSHIRRKLWSVILLSRCKYNYSMNCNFDYLILTSYLSQSTLLYIWDQLMLCIAGAEPVESNLSYILSCFIAIFIFLCWIRIPNHSLSDISQYEHLNTIDEQREISRKEMTSLNEQFLIIGPKLEKDDFQFLKYFFMDIFCLLTGTQQYNNNSCLLSNDGLLTSTEWSSVLRKSHLIDPSKRKEQRLLHYAELERLRNTEDHLIKMQDQLDTYKTRLKEASDEISHSKRLLSQYVTKQDYSPNKVDEINDHKMNSSLSKVKWKSNLHKITLLRNVAQNFGANIENSNPLKQSQVIQTEYD
ncbi:uncharacterized protein DC041_0011692 [Schistosoma bovis]|uniref:Uncharacterized protein n=1 Tax=Schistosoma bovis TaxID=6184 RepID=A0A430QIL6_SCHBO|nr:uncharacterized protein DC041_0011692 [Schistosoma bovis]